MHDSTTSCVKGQGEKAIVNIVKYSFHLFGPLAVLPVMALMRDTRKLRFHRVMLHMIGDGHVQLKKTLSSMPLQPQLLDALGSGGVHSGVRLTWLESSCSRPLKSKAREGPLCRSCLAWRSLLEGKKSLPPI